MRVYLPATLPVLAAFVGAGGVGPAPVLAFAVTPSLREWYTSGDLEELEYASLLEAARQSLRLLEQDPLAPRRRVVLAADVPDGSVAPAPDLNRATVRLGAVIPLTDVVSVHVDAPEAADDVGAGVAAVVAADLGDEDARFVVDGVEDHELLWYAVQEIPDLLHGDEHG
ncbi:MAG: DUF6912 family protein [Streptomycetales bacterium]